MDASETTKSFISIKHSRRASVLLHGDALELLQISRGMRIVDGESGTSSDAL